MERSLSVQFDLSCATEEERQFLDEAAPVMSSFGRDSFSRSNDFLQLQANPIENGGLGRICWPMSLFLKEHHLDHPHDTV